MVSNGLVTVFNKSWLIIKLNLFFWLFSLLGGIVFGLGPAIQMVSDLYIQATQAQREISIKEAFGIWKFHFKRSNQQIYLFLLISCFLVYNLFLATQMQGMIWLAISFTLVAAIMSLLVLYLYIVLYESLYDMPFFSIIQLAFISLFLSFGGFWKVYFGLVSILGVTWFMKGLVLFATISLVVGWMWHATRTNREFIEQRLAQDE